MSFHWAVTFGVLGSIFVLAFGNRHLNARLEKLEAVSTVAQQPQERHYFPDINGDSTWIRVSADTAYHKRSDNEWLSINYSYRKKITAPIR